MDKYQYKYYNYPQSTSSWLSTTTTHRSSSAPSNQRGATSNKYLGITNEATGRSSSPKSYDKYKTSANSDNLTAYNDRSTGQIDKSTAYEDRSTVCSDRLTGHTDKTTGYSTNTHNGLSEVTSKYGIPESPDRNTKQRTGVLDDFFQPQKQSDIASVSDEAKISDPRTPLRKMIDLMTEMREMEVEKCLADYRMMMEGKDPGVLTKEEEFHRSKTQAQSRGNSNVEDRLRRERYKLQQEKEELRKENEELKTRTNDLESQSSSVSKAEMELMKEQIEKIKSNYEEKKRKQLEEWRKALEDRQIKEIENENKLKEEIGRLQKEKVKMENEKAEEIRKLQIEKDGIEKEKTDALSRLSKEMGKKLNDKNPNITDLSDSNRPTKIAEKYNELYDNEWTDALEVLTEEVYTEETAIQDLLTCIQACYAFCEEDSTSQMNNLRRELSVPNSHTRDVWEEQPSVDSQTEKILKEIRKNQRVPGQTLLKGFERSTYFKATYKKIPAYTCKCLELCWSMVMHDPHVVLGPPAKEGSEFDPNMYKEYTKTGFQVNYTVWLPLFLHEKGALLQKGVVQPYPKSKSIRAKPSQQTRDVARYDRYDTPSNATSTQPKATADQHLDMLFDQPPRHQQITRTTDTHKTYRSSPTHETPAAASRGDVHRDQPRLQSTTYNAEPKLVEYLGRQYVAFGYNLYKLEDWKKLERQAWENSQRYK